MPLYRHRPREASCFADETRIADWQTSAYVLPYAVGATFRVSQANCSPPGDGHRGSERYAYDFDMPIGTSFVAVRAGVVVHIETSTLMVRWRQPDSIITSSSDIAMGPMRGTGTSRTTARRSSTAPRCARR